MATPSVEARYRESRDFGAVVGPAQDEQGVKIPILFESCAFTWIHEPALGSQCGATLRCEDGAVRGIGGDEVALRGVVAGHEAGDPPAEKAPDGVGSSDRVRGGPTRVDQRASVMDETRDLELEITRRFGGEERAALERVSEEVERLTVGVVGTAGEQSEQLVHRAKLDHTPIVCLRRGDENAIGQGLRIAHLMVAR